MPLLRRRRTGHQQRDQTGRAKKCDPDEQRKLFDTHLNVPQIEPERFDDAAQRSDSFTTEDTKDTKTYWTGLTGLNRISLIGGGAAAGLQSCIILSILSKKIVLFVTFVPLYVTKQWDFQCDTIRFATRFER